MIIYHDHLTKPSTIIIIIFVTYLLNMTLL